MSFLFVFGACEKFALEIRCFMRNSRIDVMCSKTPHYPDRSVWKSALCGVIYEIFTAFHDACNKL